MPTLCFSSPLLKTTADGLSLAVGITHQLRLATDDRPILKLQKFPPPESLDILSSAGILLRLTGSFGGEEICTETLLRSSLVAYLLEYLKFVWDNPALRRIHSLLTPHSMPLSCSLVTSLTPTSVLTELSSVCVFQNCSTYSLTIADSHYRVVSCVAGPG